MPEQVALTPPSNPPPTPSAEANQSILGQQPLEHRPLFDLFGLTRPADSANPKHNQALSEIWAYAKEIAPNKDKESIAFEVMRLKSRLGHSGFENNPYLKVHMYVKTYRQAREADQRLRELEAGNTS